jgi:O-antigen ligase
MKAIDKLKYVIYSFSFLGAEMYSAYCSLTDHIQEIGDSTYLMYMIALFVLSCLFILRDIANGARIAPLSIIIPLIYTFFYLYDIFSEHPQLDWTTKSYIFFIFFNIPKMLIAGIFLSNGTDKYFYKYFELVVLLLGLAMILYLPRMALSSGIIEGYNNISYQSALSFGVVFYGIVTSNTNRFLIFTTKTYKILSVCICVLLAICTLSSGGRGGVVLLIAEFVVISLVCIKKSKVVGLLLCLIPIWIIATNIVSNNSSMNRALNVGMNRAFEYISGGSIDMKKTSNRDLSFEIAKENISKNPITGVGIFHAVGAYGYPHNIFLEILEGGGIIYFLIWIYVILKCVKNGLRRFKSDTETSYLLPLILYPNVMLLFSSSYLFTGLFWFTIIYLYSNK